MPLSKMLPCHLDLLQNGLPSMTEAGFTPIPPWGLGLPLPRRSGPLFLSRLWGKPVFPSLEGSCVSTSTRWTPEVVEARGEVSPGSQGPPCSTTRRCFQVFSRTFRASKPACGMGFARARLHSLSVQSTENNREEQATSSVLSTRGTSVKDSRTPRRAPRRTDQKFPA